MKEILAKTDIVNLQRYTIGSIYNFLMTDGRDIRGRVISQNIMFVEVEVIEE